LAEKAEKLEELRRQLHFFAAPGVRHRKLTLD
jgi:hypothetical protein